MSFNIKNLGKIGYGAVVERIVAKLQKESCPDAYWSEFGVRCRNFCIEYCGSFKVGVGHHLMRTYMDVSNVEGATSSTRCNSGPYYTRWVGEELELRDDIREDSTGKRFQFVFFDDNEFHPRMFKKPRRTIHYEGSDEAHRIVRRVVRWHKHNPCSEGTGEAIHAGLAPYLLPNDDLGRRYSAQGTPHEPLLLRTSDVVEEMRQMLEDAYAQL